MSKLNIKNNKAIFFTILSIIGIILITIATSYAFFNYAKEGNKTSTITAGDIVFHYDEITGKGRGISIVDAFPANDNEEEKSNNEYFDFRITSKTTSVVDIPYVVTARMSKNSDIIMGDITDVYLTEIKDNIETPTELFEENLPKYNELEQYSNVDVNDYVEKIIYTDIVPAKTANYDKTFRLRIWVDDKADFSPTKNPTTNEYEYPYNDKVFSLTVNVYANGSDQESNLDSAYVYQNEINYTDGMATLINPDRGLYRPVSISIDQSTGLFKTNLGNSVGLETKQAINNSMSLIHLRVNICQLSGNCNSSGEDKDFTTDQINGLNAMLDQVRKIGGKVIIRFLYDDTGAVDKDPKSFNTILNHVSQLSTVFNKNKDVITLIETGFIGPWGEMHSSSYADDAHVKSLVEALLASAPSNITVNVRTPLHYIAVFGSLNSTNSNTNRVGIFNDGYLGSATDLGTFVSGITRENFVDWMSEKGKKTMYGGEVTKFDVNDPNYSSADEAYSEGSFAISEMPLTHTTYFNSQFNLNILDTKWKNQTYTNQESEYDNTTYYKYIIDHLGYRFVLRDSYITDNIKQGSKAAVKFNLENVGFGNVVPKYETKLILFNGTDYYETKLNTNINTFYGGTTTNTEVFFYVPSDIEPGTWDVYLKIVDPNNSFTTIRFANPNIYHENLMANKLGKITIVSDDSSGVKFKQADVLDAPNGKKKTLTSKPVYVPVTIGYVNHSNFTTMSTQELTLPMGTEIDFNNSAQLENLGINLPDDYYFTQVSSEFVNWESGLKKITIPNDSSTNGYWINVYLKQYVNPTVQFIFADSITKQEITRVDKVIDRGTTIDFNNNSQLASLGLTLPSGYKFAYANCSFVNNFQNVMKITIPAEDYDTTMYWVSVYVSDKPQLEFTYVNADTETEMEVDRVNTFVPHGTTIDFTDSTQLANLGITVPEGYDFAFARYCFDGVNWLESQTVTIPSDDQDIYWIHLYFKEPPSTDLVLQYIDTNETNLNITKTLYDVAPGTVIDFTNSSQMASLGITIPEGYRFSSIRYLDYNTNEWTYYKSSYTVASENLDSTYWITVILEEIGD